MNATNAAGYSALLAAVRENHLEIVKTLIGAGADVDARLTGSDTPLIKAAETGSVAIANELLATGANVHARDAKNRTAVFWVQTNGRFGPSADQGVVGTPTESGLQIDLAIVHAVPDG